MSRYDHKIETSKKGIEHLSKEKKEEKRHHIYNRSAGKQTIKNENEDKKDEEL